MGTSLKKVAKKAKDYKYVLLVMRHAKTEPFGDGGDAGRELTDKGRKQAKAVAKGLAAHKMVPTRIACSSATRARQTCDRMPMAGELRIGCNAARHAESGHVAGIARRVRIK